MNRAVSKKSSRDPWISRRSKAVGEEKEAAFSPPVVGTRRGEENSAMDLSFFTRDSSIYCRNAVLMN